MLRKRMVGYKAFTIVEIMIVVAVIGILVAIAVPGFIKARSQARRNACQENLQKIDHAKTRWAMDEIQGETATPDWSDLVGPNRDGYLGSTPYCPGSGTYTIGMVRDLPTCDFAGPPIHELP